MSDIIEASYRAAVTKWVNEHAWPRLDSDVTTALLAVSGSGTSFSFQTFYSVFRVTAKYNGANKSLDYVGLGLVIPGYSNVTLLTEGKNYALSDNDGVELPFNILNVIHGKISFKHQNGNSGGKEVAFKYDVYLPLGNLVDTVSISPTNVNEDFATTEIEDLSILTSQLPSLQGDLADFSGSGPVATQTHLTDPEAELLIEFLRDFGQFKVVIEAHKHAYTFNTVFFGVFDLAGSIDPKTLTVESLLSVRLLVAELVTIAPLGGSLVTGVQADVNSDLARGTVALSAERERSGKHVLYVNLSLSIRYVGPISTGGKFRLQTLPF